MKLIGRTPSGGVIVEAELLEYLTLIEAGRSLAILPVVEFATSAPAEISPTETGRITARPALRKSGDGRRTGSRKLDPRYKTCEMCRKKFMDDSRGCKRIICKNKDCLKALKRRQRKAWYKNRKAKSDPSSVVRRPSSVPNPADPGLTDEERGQIRAERMAGMMQRKP